MGCRGQCSCARGTKRPTIEEQEWAGCTRGLGTKGHKMPGAIGCGVLHCTGVGWEQKSPEDFPHAPKPCKMLLYNKVQGCLSCASFPGGKPAVWGLAQQRLGCIHQGGCKLGIVSRDGKLSGSVRVRMQGPECKWQSVQRCHKRMARIHTKQTVEANRSRARGMRGRPGMWRM